jgi:hypothetical protein
MIKSACVWTLLALVPPCLAAAQDPDSLRADSAFRRSDWRATAESYERIAASQPAQGMAWLRLGMARHALNDIDGAFVAYEKARELQWQPATVYYRLARVYSLRGDLDKSFLYLDQLVPLRAVPLIVLDTTRDLAAARRDARYQAVAEKVTALRFPCRSTPETRQFDFWIGNWDVTPFRAPPASNPPLLGTNRIELLLEQCLLMENWQGGGPAPSAGKSMNFYDTNRRKWRQVWIADGGGSLDYTGEFRDGAMRFDGWTLAPNGQRILQKLTFFPIGKDTVRQLFETSSDSGKTWVPGFDGRYVRSKRK